MNKNRCKLLLSSKKKECFLLIPKKKSGGRKLNQKYTLMAWFNFFIAINYNHIVKKLHLILYSLLT